MSYKLQDVPDEDFEMRVYACYVDIIRGDRYKEMDSGILSMSGLFGGFIDVDRMNDLALCFDTQFWRVAYELGIQVKDYSSRPGLTFLVSNDDIVVDGGSDRKQWDSVKAYIDARLAAATIHPDLNQKEANKHKEFLWEVLQTQRMRDMDLNASVVDCWEEYSDYAEKKLGKKLRRIAKAFDMPIPSLAAVHVRLRCNYCDKPEGEVVGDDGKPGAKLQYCECNPNGQPYYCNSSCQKADWPSHKEFCTEVGKKKGKKKKDEESAKKKRKDRKKKK